MSQGFYLLSPARFQKKKREKKSLAITSFHWWNWLLLEMNPNVYVCMYVCVCVCVRPHRREAAAIASGCTPLYVSDPGLMKLKAWQLWGASAEPQSDGHLILPPCPRGATHIWGPCLLFARWLGAPVYPRCRRSCHICCGCHLEGLLDCHSSLSRYRWTGDITGSEADQIHVFGKLNCQVFFFSNLFICIPPHVIQSESLNWPSWLSLLIVCVMTADGHHYRNRTPKEEEMILFTLQLM